MSTDVETVVIGAGAVGLATAEALARIGQEVMVLDRGPRIGSETSSRSSEVIHAGLYYPKGSLRARFCVEGRDRMYAFAQENGVPHLRCGKILVATAEDEIDALEAVAEKARINGVTDLVSLTAKEARNLEPEINCVAAIFSPSSGVIDSHAYMVALEGHIGSLGGQVVLNSPVSGLRHDNRDGAYEITVGESTLTAKRLVIAAGHGASALGRMLFASDPSRVPETYPARGHYYTVSGKPPFRHLVYPIPKGPWLGIHFTRDRAGQAKFGPDHQWIETVDYSFDDSEERRARFDREVRRYWPGLPINGLEPAYVGVRPKIYREGEPARDFVIEGPAAHGLENCVAMYGIESPGLTSSLAIGAYAASLL